MYSYFPEFLYEGIIKEIDYVNNLCKIAPLSVRNDTSLQDVPIPHIVGSGNAGIWLGNLTVGSRVIVANTSGEGTEFSVIIANIPQSNLFPKIFNSEKPIDTPSGTIAYPDMREGRIILRGDSGSELVLLETGEIALKAGGGGAGYYIKKFGLKSTAAYRVINEESSFTNAGRFYQGSVRRISSAKRQFFPKTSLAQAPLFVDLDFHNVATPLGFFNGSSCYKYSYNKKKRNPEISEHRVIINEFSTESMFTGFDDEVQRIKKEKSLFDKSDTFERYREPSNTLQLAEGELIEIIGGNLIDINGNILDINYNKVKYGEAGNRVPETDIEKKYDEARRISRRGVGFHFQLSTNVLSSQTSSTQNSFIFDIDKEGLLKLNVPKSSDTGNIPFPSISTFEDGAGNIKQQFANPSIEEPVPVLLRDENGNAVLPNILNGYRNTGIRFSNSGQSSYFQSNTSSSTGTIRVNTTKYHNMYAIAERLIANNISEIYIPEVFTNDEGYIEGISIGKPFEVLEQEQIVSEDINNFDTKVPSYMSIVKVFPDAPAIFSGGDTTVAGSSYNDDEAHPPFSNSFSLQDVGNGQFEASIVNSNDERGKNIGGKSALLNFEGSIEASIGRDNTDKKSIMLDTAGSLIAWLGKDANGRSSVIQTDGDMLINIGGTYNSDGSEEPGFNKGKFVLRVNVVDKKFVNTEFDGDNPGADSDYIISISEDGLVIAGMKQGSPMVIRNDGKILIESSTDLVLKGQKVEFVDSKGRSTTPNTPGRG